MIVVLVPEKKSDYKVIRDVDMIVPCDYDLLFISTYAGTRVNVSQYNYIRLTENEETLKVIEQVLNMEEK